MLPRPVSCLTLRRHISTEATLRTKCVRAHGAGNPPARICEGESHDLSLPGTESLGETPSVTNVAI